MVGEGRVFFSAGVMRGVGGVRKQIDYMQMTRKFYAFFFLLSLEHTFPFFFEQVHISISNSAACVLPTLPPLLLQNNILI